MDKEKIQELISQKRINLADVGYQNLDDITTNTEVSEQLGLNLSEVANIAENFENPNIPDHNDNLLVHRFFCAGGETYRVKTTINEYRNENHPKPYSFEVTEIELLDSEEPSRALERGSADNGHATPRATNIKDKIGLRKISGKKLLQGVATGGG